MDAFVETLFKYRPVVYERGDFVLAAPWPMLIIVAVAAIGFVLAWAYRRARGKSTPRDRVVLTAVRVAIVALAGFALLRPTLLVSTAVPQKNAVAILIDDSRSMRITDADGRARADVAQRRSEERRVGKECRWRGRTGETKQKERERWNTNMT